MTRTMTPRTSRIRRFWRATVAWCDDTVVLGELAAIATIVVITIGCYVYAALGLTHA